MDLQRQKKLREDFLVTLWEMHDGNYAGDRPTREICMRIGVDYDTEGSIIGQYLYRAGLVQWSSFDWISLTPKGIQEAERIVESRYAARETWVLKKIYELSNQNTVEIVGFHELVPAVGLTDREVSGICNGLEEQGYIEWPGGDYVQITAAGIRAIESLGQPKPMTGGDTYNMNIGTLHGAAQQGSGNIQNVNITVTNNPEFDKAIAAIAEIIRAADLPAEEIEELQGEIERVNKLMLSEPKPGLLERAKARVDVIKLGLAGTDALIKAAPYLEKVWELLKARLNLS